jgi:hypothetical protein
MLVLMFNFTISRPRAATAIRGALAPGGPLFESAIDCLWSATFNLFNFTMAWDAMAFGLLESAGTILLEAHLTIAPISPGSPFAILSVSGPAFVSLTMFNLRERSFASITSCLGLRFDAAVAFVVTLSTRLVVGSEGRAFGAAGAPLGPSRELAGHRL